MTDFKNNKFIEAILVWGILSWAFLVARFWFRHFEFGKSGLSNLSSENPVSEIRIEGFDLMKDSGKAVQYAWQAPKYQENISISIDTPDGIYEWFKGELSKGGHLPGPNSAR